MVISAWPDTLTPVPHNPLPRMRQLKEVRNFHSGFEVLRDAGGPITRLDLAPRWIAPPIVLVTSPRGAHDVLGGTDSGFDKAPVHQEMLRLLGPNLFDLKHDPWKPRRRSLQPIFTKQRVRSFAGDMAQAAAAVNRRWVDGAMVDLDSECRRLTLRALGRSVLGLSLDDHAEDIAEPLQTALGYIADRALSPLHGPRWLPTPANHRAKAAAAFLHGLAGDILTRCRREPDHDAPLVRSLMSATDPDTGRTLSDEEMRGELIAFMAAGHDTTATLLAYTLWVLGCHPDIQHRVFTEVAPIGERQLTPDDVPHLGYTVQVLHEALRLCPPASGVMRMATRDMSVAGYRVESGTIVGVGICAMHRDPALWDRPLTFDPQRFSPAARKSIDRWQYIPFGAGPRSCIGDHFAILEAALALATIVRRTRITSCSDTFPLQSPFTTVADGPINVRVTTRCPANE